MLNGLKQCSKLRRMATSLAVDNRSCEKYFMMMDELRFLYSPHGLKDRAGLCIDVTEELFEVLFSSNNAAEGLNIIDSINNTMCLLLDPAEAVRNVHPCSIYRGTASSAFQTVYSALSEINTSRRLYNVIADITKESSFATLSPIQKQNATLLRAEMDGSGAYLDQASRSRIAYLSAEQERLSHDLTTASEDENDVLNNLLDTRHSLAATLGRESYASWVMENTLVGTPQNAWKFLNKLSEVHRQKAENELKLLISLKSKVFNKPNASTITDYEHKELANIYKTRKYGAVLNKLSEYLSVGNAWRGLQHLCKKLFDITMKPEVCMEEWERYHPSVQKYVLYESNGAVLGTIYADLLQRPDKMQGAGHFTIQLGTTLHTDVLDEIEVAYPSGGQQKPIVIFTCNAKGGEGNMEWESVLLSPDELATLFHEFGHALHTLFGQQEYQNLCGTRSSLDFVEIFSQMFEYFARDHRVLQEFAWHHKTGEPIPSDLVGQLRESEDCFKGLDTVDQLILSGADLSFHGPRPMTFTTLSGDSEICTPESVIPSLLQHHTPINATLNALRQSYSVQHMSNYPAAYYSYAYSKVIAASLWAKHFEENPWCAEGGRAVRTLMGLGASMKPKDMLATALSETDACEMLNNLDLRLM